MRSFYLYCDNLISANRLRISLLSRLLESRVSVGVEELQKVDLEECGTNLPLRKTPSASDALFLVQMLQLHALTPLISGSSAS